ncbi:MAG: hypothetical protein ISR83_01795 [Candidatus Marinimicrobia bacterium]|nr:hypothetical protein [Candidatus Neomarinimicrobiota bacterium]
MHLIRLIFIPICLNILGCNLDNEINQPLHVEITASIQNIDIEGYDGYIKTDWLITNKSDEILNGWEIEVSVETPNQEIPKGLFFTHNIEMAPDSIALFRDLVLFFQNPESLYPVVLISDDSTLAYNGWEILSIKGIVNP